MRVEMQMLIMLRNMENNQELMELSLEPVLIEGAPTRDPQWRLFTGLSTLGQLRRKLER